MKIMRIEFGNVSSSFLESLAKEASKIAKALKLEEPSYELAIASGIRDKSYKVCDNHVRAYGGEAEIIMDNGSKWKAIGHGSVGDAYSVWKQGYIEFIKIGDLEDA